MPRDAALANETMPAPVDVVCALIRRDASILLARRPPGKRLAGCWEFPGGKLEPGEDAEAALHRELAEELGCRVRVLAAGPPALHAYDWGVIRLHPFLCELTPDSPPPHPHEHSELLWSPAGDLHRPDLAPADGPVIAWLEAHTAACQA